MPARYLDVSPHHTTAESYVFLQPDGERSIIMASGATSTINQAVSSVPNVFFRSGATTVDVRLGPQTACRQGYDMCRWGWGCSASLPCLVYPSMWAHRQCTPTTMRLHSRRGLSPPKSRRYDSRRYPANDRFRSRVYSQP